MYFNDQNQQWFFMNIHKKINFEKYFKKNSIENYSLKKKVLNLQDLTIGQ